MLGRRRRRSGFGNLRPTLASLLCLLVLLPLLLLVSRVQCSRQHQDLTLAQRSVPLQGTERGHSLTRHLYEDDYEDDENEEGDYDYGDNEEGDGLLDYEDREYDLDQDDVFERGSSGKKGYEDEEDEEEDFFVGERGGGEEDYEDDEDYETDLGFDEGEDEQGMREEEEEEEEDFGDYYDNEDYDYDNSEPGDDDNGEGGDGSDQQDEDGNFEGEEGDLDSLWGFENGDEDMQFTSFCESANRMNDTLKPCDILVEGLDENISKTHLRVDGVYTPVQCKNGYLQYSPSEGEDAFMIAFNADFEEWGFYNSTEISQENLLLHGADFVARVPQEVEAWYCDVKVCETDTENEHYWTPITTASIQCITEEEEMERIKLMGTRKNQVIFPGEEDRVSKRSHIYSSLEEDSNDDNEYDSTTYQRLNSGTGRAKSGGGEMFVVVLIIILGFSLYLYTNTKQAKLDGQGATDRRGKRTV